MIYILTASHLPYLYNEYPYALKYSPDIDTRTQYHLALKYYSILVCFSVVQCFSLIKQNPYRNLFYCSMNCNGANFTQMENLLLNANYFFEESPMYDACKLLLVSWNFVMMECFLQFCQFDLFRKPFVMTDGIISTTLWGYQMETFSALLAICAGNSLVTGEFPAQRPVMLSFDVFFDLCLNKRLSKQLWGWWFKMPSHPLWRHCNDTGIFCTLTQFFVNFVSGWCITWWAEAITSPNLDNSSMILCGNESLHICEGDAILLRNTLWIFIYVFS